MAHGTSWVGSIQMQEQNATLSTSLPACQPSRALGNVQLLALGPLAPS